MEKRRILTNSTMLYVRTFLTLALTLYSSRLILQNLGVTSYGVFNVVGGVALFFSFLNNALTLSTQRFITVAITRDDTRRVREVFTMSVKCHLMIAGVVLLFCETIGLWFLNTQLNIPLDTMGQANVVYQACVAVCLLGVINVPYMGAIVAYERMRFFSMLSILSAALKVVVAVLIAFFGSDRLVPFALMLLGITMVQFAVSRIYCVKHLAGCRELRYHDRDLFGRIMRFSGWNMFKMCANMGVAQGYNVIVNIFGGPMASAAMGIASQVGNAANSFMTNVQTAFNPRITAHVACNEYRLTADLMGLCVKFGMFMMLMIGLPLIVNIHPVLHLWLGIYPPATATLCQLALVSIMADCFISPISTAVMAKGAISRYQSVTSVILLIALPVAWIALDRGMAIGLVLVVKIAVQALVAVYSAYYACRNLRISFTTMVWSIYGRAAAMTVVATLITVAASRRLWAMGSLSEISYVVVTTLISWTALLLCAMAIGTDRADRKALAAYLQARFHGRHHRKEAEQ